MKPYEELTHLGRVRRMRQLAKVALAEYGLADSRFKLVIDAGNTLFRVYASEPTLARTAIGRFYPGQYLLRIHQPGYQTADAIELELAWLTALRRDADVPVPEPVPTLDGRVLIQASFPGIPGERNCSLLRWLKGRFLQSGIGPHHYRAQGQLMARMHNHAVGWQPPRGLTKRHYDWDGLFMNDSGTGLPASEAWPLLPGSYVEPFKVVARRVRRVMDEWGTGHDVYGLIHADLGVDANLLFWGGEARAIDFDDSGFGYWVYDLGVALEHCREDATFAQYRDALLDGYTETRSLSEEHSGQIELFIAALDVYLSLWCAAAAHLHPRHREALNERMDRAARLVECYLHSS